MNRIIKFRAYCKKRKRMYKVLHLYSGMLGDSVLTWATVKGFDIIEQKDIHLKIQPEHCIIMQFTGLYDCNDKEIYEGDVVKMHQFLFDGYSETECEHFGVVAYNNESASFNFTRIKGKFYSEHTGYPEGEDIEGCPISNFYGLHEESFTIIGNIYENPTLI